MPFFDSAKNRAMWERRLSGLRQEKERRRETGFAPQETARETVKAAENPYRRQITFKDLEARAMEESGVRRVRRPGRQMRASREMEHEKNLEKTGMSL